MEALIPDGWWEHLVRRCVPEVKLVILECLERIEQPLSPVMVRQTAEDAWSLHLITHHVRSLVDDGVIEPIGWRPRRGAVESFYFWPFDDLPVDRQYFVAAFCQELQLRQHQLPSPPVHPE